MTGNKKTFLEEMPLVPYPFVARLMSEIKDASGLTHEKLADELAGKLDDDEDTLSGTMVAQYISGKRTMSQSRMGRIARGAEELGLDTPAVKEALLWKKLLETSEYPEMGGDFKAEAKKGRRTEALLLSKLESVIADLVREEWTNGEIVALAILLAEKHTPEEARTRGGMIDLARLRSVMPTKETGGDINSLWLTWSFESPTDLNK